MAYNNRVQILLYEQRLNLSDMQTGLGVQVELSGEKRNSIIFVRHILALLNSDINQTYNSIFFTNILHLFLPKKFIITAIFRKNSS